MHARSLAGSLFVSLAALFQAAPVSAQCSTLVYGENFESSGGAFPPGWTATGLWHMTQSCALGCVDGWTPYFGIDAQCNYDAGAVLGALSSPWIDLPDVGPAGSIVLNYCEADATECEVETFTLRVEEFGGGSTSQSIDCDDAQPPYDMSAHSGKTVRLHWYFDAVDPLFNDTTGIQIDNIEITAYTGTSGDCNQNMIPDDCDIALGLSDDCDQDQVPDECQGLSQVIPCAKPNSVGSGATLSNSGAPILSCNNLVLEVTKAPPGKIGLFLYGPQFASVPFGEGLLCVGGAIHRLSPPVRIGGDQSASLHVDYTTLSGGGEILPGSQWYFQFWYRDPAGGPAGFNLSHMELLEFVP